LTLRAENGNVFLANGFCRAYDPPSQPCLAHRRPERR
jgi:hypothetical protein